MKKLLSFFMLLTLFFGVGWAEEESTTIESTNQLGTELGWSNENLTFSFTATPSATNYSVELSDNARGLGTGAKTGTHVLTSDQTFSSIYKVEVTASTNGSNNTISVSVGDAAFGDAQTIASGTANANTVYSFESTTGASGNVVITITDNNKSVWIKTIKVYYGEAPTPATKLYLTGTFNEWNTTSDEMTLGADGKYTITMALAAEARVKFIDDSENWYGAPADAGTYFWLTQTLLGETITIGTGDGYQDIYFPVAGEWTFSVDLENEEVMITGQWPGAYETVTIPYEETLVSDIGKFVVENVEMGGLETIWQSNQYGLTGNGYNCTGNVESWCLSPLIDASSVAGVTLTFDENARFFADSVFAEQATLWVREGSDGAWAAVTIPNHVIATSNSFANVGDIDLSAYAGKVFQLGFKYTATTTSPGRWEIKNLAVTETAAQVPQVATVAEIKASTDKFEFSGTSLVATAQNGSYLYAQDATGGILIYGSVGQTYKLGQVIPAGFTGTLSEFHGAPQVGSPADFTAATDSVEVTPVEFAVADFKLDNFGIYGVVRGATVSGNTIAFSDTTFATYTTLASVPTDASGKIYDVYGIMGWRDGVQFLPTEYIATGATNHAAPTITVDPEKEVYFVGENVTVTFTSEETDVNIGYDIEDITTFPDVYTPLGNGESIIVTANEPKTVNVRAFAYGYNEGDELGKSEVVTKAITFIVEPEAGDQYELVTSADQIAAGNEYVLVYSDDNVTKAMAGSYTTTTTFRSVVDAGETEFVINDTILTLMSGTQVTPFTLEAAETEGYYNIKIDGDQYIYWESGNSALTGETKGEVTVTLDSEGNVEIQYNESNENEDRFLRYNTSSPRFAFYKSGQKNGQLYVKKAAATVKPGDANEDGEVDVRDITTIINYILGNNPSPFNFNNANVNGDDTVNVMDVTVIINMILGTE